MEKLQLLLGISLFLSLGLAKAAPSGALVSSLPGFHGTFPSKHYSGFISFDEKNLFYYFVVSERNPSKDPVVLWLNGGPGCSSFDGFVYEHGPFNYQEPRANGSLPTLTLNPYSWSKVSNIIYLDSPCGTGLSYSLNKSKYNTSDHQTAADTHSFLLQWFQLYPEFASNPLYVSGESYAGIYVPTLSHRIVQGIESGTKPVINFKGYLVGNGVTNSDFELFHADQVPFARGVALISDEMYEEIASSCKKDKSTCATGDVLVRVLTSKINPYAILEPCYLGPSKSGRPATSKVRLGRTWWPLEMNGKTQDEAQISGPFFDGDPTAPDCVNDESAWVWLNDESVREAIHAKPKSVSGNWELCSGWVFEGYIQEYENMIPYHKNLTTQGYRALIYSGDHDMVVPHVGSQAWTRSLAYKTIDKWRPWLLNRQVAGFVQGYENNLTFLTVKGAGHMVPQYKPAEALAFYTRWLDGNPI